MQALLTGIYGVYTGGGGATFRAACTGGLHLEEAPQYTAMPYATFTMIVARPDYYFSGHLEIATIQFDIYAATNTIRQDLYTKLTALFDNCKPTVTGYTSLIMKRVSQQSVREGEQSEVYRYTVEYEVTIDK